jgi:hypothetical protein
MFDRRPRYSPLRPLAAIALVLGPWAMLPVAALFAGRVVYVALFTDPTLDSHPVAPLAA